MSRMTSREDVAGVRAAGRATAQAIEEIVLATNLTVEGEVTAHYIGEFLKNYHLRTTRIAQGVSIDGEGRRAGIC